MSLAPLLCRHYSLYYDVTNPSTMMSLTLATMTSLFTKTSIKTSLNPNPNESSTMMSLTLYYATLL